MSMPKINERGRLNYLTGGKENPVVRVSLLEGREVNNCKYNTVCTTMPTRASESFTSISFGRVFERGLQVVYENPPTFH